MTDAQFYSFLSIFRGPRSRVQRGKRLAAAFSTAVLTLSASAFALDASAREPNAPLFVAPQIAKSDADAEKAEPETLEPLANADEIASEPRDDDSLLDASASGETTLEILPPLDDATSEKDGAEGADADETDVEIGAALGVDATLKAPLAPSAQDDLLDAGLSSVAAPKSGASSNSVERAPYDPIRENGEYFAGWDKPQVALVVTGLTNGYIEPCGCAGMDRMKGGLSRRHTFLTELRGEFGWDVVAVDAGQTTVGFGVQEELKFDMASNAFRLMEYDAIGIGKGELRFPAYFLLTFTAPTSAETPSPFTSANVGVYGFNAAYALPYKIVERGGLRIGVVSVLCPSEEIEHRDENLLVEAPEKKLKEIAPALERAACDRLVLIVHGTEAETSALAKKFPQYDFVVTADSPSEPPAEGKTIGGDDSRRLIEVGEKGKFAVVLGLYPDGEIKYQRVALDSRYESSSEIALLMKDYQTILKTLVSTKGYRGGLGIAPVRSPKADLLGKYVGAKKCRSCHEESYRVWSRSRHATAWKSLTETATPPRDFDPECVGCHVDGWEGIQHFPYVDGFVTEEKTPELKNVGCESCHGPGEKHIAAELDSDEAAQETIRAAMRLGDNVAKNCYSCHDGDNSPEFDFDQYYPLIEHQEAGDDE